MSRELVLSHTLPPVSAMLVGQQALVKLYIISALQKTHIFGEYVLNDYCDLIFDISTKIGLNQLERLVFMCRKQISKDSHALAN